jgi:hypothetical protein
MNDFETWWYHEGSGPRLPGEDNEEHCKRMCKIAWSNGAFKARQETENPKQCWRCGDMDPKFIAECEVPACDMKGKP